MISQTETIFFERKAIAYFLRNNAYNWQKYNELMAAVVMSKLYSAGTDLEDAPIGFVVKSNYYHQKDDGLADLEKLHLIIDKMKEDDTPIDMIVSHIDIDKIPIRRVHTFGWVYQIKRFITKPGEDATEKLIDFLNRKIPQKYSKTQARLLILLEVVDSIDLLCVVKKFRSECFPFTHVQFIAFDFKGGTYIRFGDIWPEQHMYVGDVNRFFE